MNCESGYLSGSLCTQLRSGTGGRTVPGGVGYCCRRFCIWGRRGRPVRWGGASCGGTLCGIPDRSPHSGSRRGWVSCFFSEGVTTAICRPVSGVSSGSCFLLGHHIFLLPSLSRRRLA
eukprot:01578_6